MRKQKSIAICCTLVITEVPRKTLFVRGLHYSVQVYPLGANIAARLIPLSTV